MPAGVAAVPGFLGHDAVVMGGRTDDSSAQELSESMFDSGAVDPFEKDDVPTQGLFEPSDGAAPFGHPGNGRSRIVNVGLIFNRFDESVNSFQSDVQHALAERRIAESANDDKPLSLKMFNLMIREPIKFGKGQKFRS